MLGLSTFAPSRCGWAVNEIDRNLQYLMRSQLREEPLHTICHRDIGLGSFLYGHNIHSLINPQRQSLVFWHGNGDRNLCSLELIESTNGQVAFSLRYACVVTDLLIACFAAVGGRATGVSAAKQVTILTF